MPALLGAHSPRIAAVRELLAKKGRREQQRFTFEGPTLLAEALAAGRRLEAVFATDAAYGRYPETRAAESAGIPVLLIDERALARISDLEAPSGLVAVAPIELAPVSELLAEPGIVAVLAAVSDPGNAGTLMRSAEAFGVSRIIFAAGSVDPHHPKTVRSAMGALFRLRVAVAAPGPAGPSFEGWQVTGLDAAGLPVDGLSWEPRSAIVVGGERRGLGDWAALCTRTAAIPMLGNAESLNAAVAGSIALYEAAKRLHP